MSEETITDLEILREMMEDYGMGPEDTIADFLEAVQDAENEDDTN